MSKEFESLSSSNEEVELVKKLEALLGDEQGSRLYSNLLTTLRVGGKKQCQLFCYNESDKFRDRPDIIHFLEREVFDAGNDGLGVETPWNTVRRLKMQNTSQKQTNE